jgi:DNA-binding CsgD family transcriptional regulator
MRPTLVLTFLLALAAGLISLALVSRRSQHHFSPVTEALVAPLLFYNLWILVWLIFQYTEATLLGGLPPLASRALVAGLTWTSMAVCIQWGASYLAFTRSAIQAVHPHELLGKIRKTAFLLTIAAAVVCVSLLLLHQDLSIRFISRGLNALTFLTVAALSVHFWLKTRRIPMEEGSSQKLGVLGAAYSLIFGALTIVVGWNRLSSGGSQHRFILLAVGLEMIYNLATVLWIYSFDRTPLHLVPAPTAPPPAKLADRSLSGTYGISKREEEVIHLVCQGLTNQEIADKLFISLKTVKDHNYRIFQKTGVRNRVELAQLVQRLSSEKEGEFQISPSLLTES